MVTLMVTFFKIIRFTFFNIIFLFSVSVIANSNALRSEGLAAFKEKLYPQASLSFYKWSRQAKTLAEKQEAKYFLGIALAKLDILQVATFPLVDVVRSGEGKYRKKALNQLASFANALDEKGLLKFTIEKLTPEDLTDLSKSAFYINMSDIAYEEGQIDKAMSWAQMSLDASPKNDEALYQLASLALEKNKYPEALAYFSQLLEKHKSKSPADKKRGLATLNIARVYYQMKDWTKAAEFYRQVAKDHVDYRSALQELSWTLLRSAQLRSALSPLQSLLTPFYSQFFDPETFVLSSSIYIFSCQFNEAYADAEAFEKNYQPTLNQIDTWLKGSRTADDFYNELSKAQKSLENLNKTGKIESQGLLPFFVLRTIMTEPDIQSGLKYLKRMENELLKLKANFPESPFMEYAKKILKGRSLAAKRKLARAVEFYLKSYWVKTTDIADQIGFIKYEALNGQRMQLKEKMMVDARQTVDGDLNRGYYAQNGYRYWPFEGEFWRDEIGSFQYVGISRCQK